jgi:hypothetical protein
VRAEREQRAGDATGRGGPAGGYAGVPTVFLQHTCVSREGSAHEQEDLEVCRGVGIANQSGSIVSSQGSTTSSNSYPSPIVRARPQHLEGTPGFPPSSLFDPCMPEHHRHDKANRHHHESPRGLPLQPFSAHYNPLASFFVTHGISSPSSTSHRRSCSPREFTFLLFSSTTKAIPRFALIH